MKKLIFAAVTAGVLALFSGFTPLQAQVTTSGDQVLFGITFLNNELIRIDTTTGEGTLVMKIGKNEMGYGLTSYNGGLYTFSPTTNTIDQLSKIDGRVMSSTPIGVSNLAGEGDLVIGKTGAGFLASAFDSAGAPTHPLYSFDATAGTSVLLGNTTMALDGLALDLSTPQKLYALGQGDANGADPATVDTELYSVNQVTGALTPIGPIGVPQNSPVAGLTFSPDGTLYAAIDDKLYTINTTTGAATVVDPATPDFSFHSVSGLAFANGASVLANLSSRAEVLGGGDDVLISGFIITAEDDGGPTAGLTKTIVMRGLGPSLTVAGQPLAGTLADPFLSLRNANGVEIQSNDNWKQNTPADRTVITNSGLAPTNVHESVIVAHLPAGKYTAILRGAQNGNGLALEEVYDIDEGNGLKTANLSARAMVSPGTGALISGMIIEGSLPKRTLIRGLGPSLTDQEVADPLPDPQLMAFDANGTLLETNDSWMDSPEAADITASGLAPSSPLEAVIDRVFEPGAYTIVLTGVGTDLTGTALIEAYDRNSSD